MFTSNIFMHSLEQIFSDALQSSSFHTQMHSYKLKSTFSYGLHKHSLTYEQAYTNEQLHTHSWKCAYTCIPSNLLTHSLTKNLLYAPSHILVHFHRYNIITKSIILICLQMNMLILTMKFTHLHTHTDALVYLHAHACTLTHRSILHFHVLSHAFTQTHMNILTFMPMVTNAPIHKKSPNHFPPANSYLNRHPQSLSHVLIHMHMVRFTCSKYSHIHLLKKLLTHLLECTGN